jgi:hypothetical protein
MVINGLDVPLLVHFIKNLLFLWICIFLLLVEVDLLVEVEATSIGTGVVVGEMNFK